MHFGDEKDVIRSQQYYWKRGFEGETWGKRVVLKQLFKWTTSEHGPGRSHRDGSAQAILRERLITTSYKPFLQSTSISPLGRALE